MQVAPLIGSGDMAGKRESAVAHANEQIGKHEGARKKLFEIQAALGGFPEAECPLQHHFAPGVYLRTIFIPAGTVIAGKIHRHAHGNILSKGLVRVFTEYGGSEEFEGPLTMVSQPGTKRIVLAVTDTTWTTIHLTESTDLAEIEADVIAPTYEDYEQFKLETEKSMNKQIEVQS